MKLPLASTLVLLAGCGNSTELVPQERIVDSFPYVDCGVVAPLDRQVCTVPIFSEGDGKAIIYDIRSVDQEFPDGGTLSTGAFYVDPAVWQDPDCGADGTCVELEGYDDESDEDTLPLEIVFAPQVVGEYRAELTIWTNDTTESEDAQEPLPDDPELEKPVWKVQLRGVSRYPCGRVWPSFLDFGRNPEGGNFYEDAQIDNCGIVTLTVGGAPESGTGMTAMDVSSTLPLYVLPGYYEPLTVGWTVGVDTDQDGDGFVEPTPVETVFAFSSNSTQLDAQTLTAIGNDCLNSVDPSWDADNDGWSWCGGDCDDDDATVNPSQAERQNNIQDDNCDGQIDEVAGQQGVDDDGDGWSEIAGDCNDADPAQSPDAVEVINQLDDDCNDAIDDNTDWYDDDGDGWSEREGDGDDTNVLVAPDVEETIDGVDNDGDGIIDEGGLDYDDDEDGYIENASDPTQKDCDDGDPWVYPGAFEFCDGYNNDCDNFIDEGEDDATDGACAFLPDRRGEVDTGVVVTEKGGCAVVPAGGAAVVAVAGLLALLRRRSDRLVGTGVRD